VAVSQVTHSASGTHVIAGVRQLLGADEERKTQGSRQERKPFAVDPGVPTRWDQVMPEITNLFVYGTLMPRELNFRQIECFVIDHNAGTVEGVLVDLGAYPALLEGDGVVKGVVLNVDADALEITDRIEGYHPDRDRCLYVREEVVVQIESKEEITAWTYLFANPDAITDYPQLIVDEIDGTPVFAWQR